MISSSTSRIVCLVHPIGISEVDLLSHKSSLSAIGSEQYLLLRQNVTDYEITLYRESSATLESDILLILTCLPLVPENIIRKFEKVVYFFDDLDTSKLQAQPVYRDRVELVDLILHPVKAVALHLLQHVGKPCFYVPWSLARVPPILEKSSLPSFYVDLDSRYRQSIPAAIEFIRSLEFLDCTVYVPIVRGVDLPGELNQRVNLVPFLVRSEFLALLSRTWFYASGIPGSYEFPVLESAFAGCGLISIHSAVMKEHQNRSSYIDFSGTEALEQLKTAIGSFDPDVIRNDARRLYPTDGNHQVQNILRDFFFAPDTVVVSTIDKDRAVIQGGDEPSRRRPGSP
jgi:hypothetical protein